MKNFLTLTQEFTKLKASYDAQEEVFKKEILFYLIDSCFELEKINKEQAKGANLIKEITFELKNYKGPTLVYLDIRFNHYEDNVMVEQGQNYNAFKNHPNAIKAYLYEFISNTVANQSVCYLLTKWLRHHYDKLKFNLSPTNANEMLDKQFAQLFGQETFNIEYEKHLLEKSSQYFDSDFSYMTEGKKLKI